MASLLDAKYSLDPCDNFMTGGIGGFVEIDNTGGDVGLEVAFQWCAATWDRSEMACSNKYLERTELVQLNRP